MKKVILLLMLLGSTYFHVFDSTVYAKERRRVRFKSTQKWVGFAEKQEEKVATEEEMLHELTRSYKAKAFELNKFLLRLTPNGRIRIINTKKDGMTPIYYATMKGDIDKFTVLLRYEADVNEKCPNYLLEELLRMHYIYNYGTRWERYDFQKNAKDMINLLLKHKDISLDHLNMAKQKIENIIAKDRNAEHLFLKILRVIQRKIRAIQRKRGKASPKIPSIQPTPRRSKPLKFKNPSTPVRTKPKKRRIAAL